MKTKILLFITIFSSIFIQYSCDADSARAICRGIAQDCFEMGATYAADWSLQTIGATTDESKQLITDFSSIVGQQNANINRGLELTRSDDYQKQQLAFDIAENNIIPNSKDPSIQIWFDAARSNFQYRHDKATAKTHDEKIQAEVDFAMRTNDIFYNAYQIQKTQKAERLSKKLEIIEQLKKNGNYDPEWAMEDASVILAIMESNDLTDEEKNQRLQQMGLYQTPEEIREIITEISSPNYVENDVTKPINNNLNTDNRPNTNSIIDKINAIKINCYELNVTQLNNQQKKELDDAINILKANNEINITLIGHTCSIGNDDINYKKGMERAIVAKDYLVSGGISENRISIESKGKTRPLMPNDSEENMAKNRRVEIVINN